MLNNKNVPGKTYLHHTSMSLTAFPACAFPFPLRADLYFRSPVRQYSSIVPNLVLRHRLFFRQESTVSSLKDVFALCVLIVGFSVEPLSWLWKVRV
ncbi:hypothetical protein DPMN_107445 [Dreissena polymorpha]|uniref:Uncharacterized protein n=1 Tax=Dreissena polymorpha TaxID=45954 RepID=A0A9D4K6V3_DREPO|nr:hypothetical protein DPMN_107445 [Dreissena polymorpha]